MRLFFALLFFPFCFSVHQPEQPELVCVRKNNARNACYYNFKIEGVHYQFIDVGCRYSREKVLEKAGEGTIALAREWKVPC